MWLFIEGEECLGFWVFLNFRCFIEEKELVKEIEKE